MRRRIISAFSHSLAGFQAAWDSEEAVNVELALLGPLVMVALYLGNSGLERAVLIGSLLLILIVELLNTAIEKTTDRISREQHPLSKKIKDMGSAAVLGAIINALVVWALILL